MVQYILTAIKICMNQTNQPSEVSIRFPTDGLCKETALAPDSRGGVSRRAAPELEWRMLSRPLIMSDTCFMVSLAVCVCVCKVCLTACGDLNSVILSQ